jgi:hypothetical protein
VEFDMRLPSLVTGAAVAAVLTVPSLAADSGWINGGWQTYDTRTLKLEDVVGTVRIDVKDNGPMAVQISGLPERVKRVHVKAGGGTLKVESEAVGSVWDWRHWFDFAGGNSNPGQLQIRIVVPRGAAVDVEETAGNVTIGNTMGPLTFSVNGNTESSVGNVATAKLEMAGSGRLNVGNVAGWVDVDSAGSGNIRIGDAVRVKADIAGSGSVTVGNVQNNIDVSIAGSGDFSAASVRGGLSTSIAGSGSVTVAGGEANPFKVDIMGSGNVSFGGMAVDPNISAMGSGSVRIKAYRGNLQNDGAKLNIGG